MSKVIATVRVVHTFHFITDVDVMSDDAPKSLEELDKIAIAQADERMKHSCGPIANMLVSTKAFLVPTT